MRRCLVSASSSVCNSVWLTERWRTGSPFLLGMKRRWKAPGSGPSNAATPCRCFSSTGSNEPSSRKPLKKVAGISLQASAGRLWSQPTTHDGISARDPNFIPQVGSSTRKKRILILCTGGTMTMVPDPERQNALSPKQGALSHYIAHHMVPELYADHMPDVVLHEYEPFLDSSDLGPDEFANVARDIYTNYLYFDGFVVVTGTDTMAYFATALSFMMENLGKPIVFTGSQIPLCYPYNDARHNLIMAILFASRGGGGPGRAATLPEPPLINEVTIFFHDRLLRANRSTKINTHQLLAFDSPNMKPLATIGISIQDTDPSGRLLLPPPQGPLRVHTQLDTRLLTLRLVPGFDDAMISRMIEQSIENQLLKGLVLQLYGTGNMPSVKESFIDLLAYARHQCGILVVATTQCLTGSVQFGHYAVGAALEQRAGVLSAYDMTMEATVYKLAYLLGQSELSTEQITELMPISLRGEITTQPQSHLRR
jgi:L-asparaginase